MKRIMQHKFAEKDAIIVYKKHKYINNYIFSSKATCNATCVYQVEKQIELCD
jgi:hypothetical protein